MGDKAKKTALKIRMLVDDVIEKILIYSSSSHELNNAAFLGAVIADLKQVKQLLVSIEKSKKVSRMTSFGICNYLLLRILKRLKKSFRDFPFSIYPVCIGKKNLWVLDKLSRCSEQLLGLSRRILLNGYKFPRITFT